MPPNTGLFPDQVVVLMEKAEVEIEAATRGPLSATARMKP